MQVDNKLLDDLARLAGGAVGALTGIRSEMEGQFRQQLERILAQMDVVGRDEFEAVKAMAANARAAQEAAEEKAAGAGDLADRVTRLEALVATLMAERELTHAEAAPKRPARKGGTSAPESGGSGAD
ncbi:MAG TPA: accessory factor UbiK family protein [Azospirillaceae bacterium]|nr:accessory factor UbiK family protein [Azospirillaceae bacterium]